MWKWFKKINKYQILDTRNLRAIYKILLVFKKSFKKRNLYQILDTQNLRVVYERNVLLFYKVSTSPTLLYTATTNKEEI